MKKREKKIIWSIIFLVVCLGIPSIINLLYYPHNFFITVWSPGDLLAYFGTVLTGSATVYLGYQANEINKRMLNYEHMSHQVYMNVTRENCELTRVTGIFEGYRIKIVAENITDIPIIGAVAYHSNKVGVDGFWDEYARAYPSSTISSIDGQKPFDIINNKLEMIFEIKNKEKLNDHIFSIKVQLTSIYNLQTEQYINVVIVNDTISNVTTMAK